MSRTREENARDLQYEETARRDFERRIYEECAAEDEALNDACERLNDPPDETQYEYEHETGEWRNDPPLQGVCKDCGNGTLNNDLSPAFGLGGDETYADADPLCCLVCGSSHLDIL